MGHLYYLFGILVFLLTLSTILNHFYFYRVKEWFESFSNITNRNPIKSEFRSQNDYFVFVTYNAILIVQSLWIIFGIVTKSWYIYVGLILLSLTLKFIFQGLKNIKVEKYSIFVFSLFKLFVILALIMNHFHFHQDWLELIN